MCVSGVNKYFLLHDCDNSDDPAYDIELTKMQENDGQQSRHWQVLPDRTRSTSQSSTTECQDIQQPHTTLPNSGRRRVVIWPFRRNIRELEKRITLDVENVRGENLRLREKVDEQEIALQKLRAALEEASKAIDNHEHKLAAQQTFAEHINERNREHQREVEGLRDDLCQLAFENASSRAVANNAKVADNVIFDIWKRMAYNIRSLANTVLTRCPGEEELAMDYQQNRLLALRLTSVEYTQLVDESMRSAVVEHFIWHPIVCCVFGSGTQRDQSEAWGGIAEKTLHSLCRTLLDGLSPAIATEFFHWRSQGAAMIERTTGSNSQALLRLVERERRKLEILLPLDKRSGLAARDSLQKELLNIFGDATELHSIFMKSRAHFHVECMDAFQRGLPYNPETMEAEILGDNTNVKSVLFCISPGLSKAGTADGGDYDRSTLLVKSRVVCD